MTMLGLTLYGTYILAINGYGVVQRRKQQKALQGGGGGGGGGGGYGEDPIATAPSEAVPVPEMLTSPNKER